MPESEFLSLLVIALAWLIYGVVHSWLAGMRLKNAVARSWPWLMPAYRLLFNGLALVLILPPLALTLLSPGTALWHWPAGIAWPALAIAILGVLFSLRYYDGGEFLGSSQWRRGSRETRDAGPFTLSPLHRHVRHPWYALGLLLLWTRDLNAAWLVTAVVVTLYVWVGSRREEEKLIALYGDAYREYRRRVPGLLPWPGRSLNATEAAALVAGAKTTRPAPGD